MLECPNCREKFRAGTRFCGSCGTPLADTISAVVGTNNGEVESLASGQRTLDFQTMDSPEETVVLKKPAGFSWQSQQFVFTHTEQPQARGYLSSEVDEATVIITKPALWPDTSPTPVVSVAPLSLDTSHYIAHTPPGEPAAALGVPGSSIHAGLTVISDPPDAVTDAAITSWHAKKSGDHAPFAIPARPGRLSASPTISDQLSGDSDEVATQTDLARTQTLETPGTRILPGLLDDPDGALIDYSAFTLTMTETALDPRSAFVPATPGLPQVTLDGPLGETFISADLMAEIEALTSATPLASNGGALASEMEAAVYPVSEQEPALIVLELAELTEEVEIESEKFFAPFRKPGDAAAHLLQPAEPYLHLKQDLAAQRMEITAAMDELLPLVYDNHREENQMLFASILAHRPPLDDEAWGHMAFVLGAYGNYMYRHPLSLTKKLEIWRAQLWAVYYERSYRRKYLAQRCQQLIHYFQGCTEIAVFLTIALRDLETLYLYLEPGSLRKLQALLQALQVPPVELLQRVEEQMVVAEQEKVERMAKQPLLAQSGSVTTTPVDVGQPARRSGVSQSANMGKPDAADTNRVAPLASHRPAVKPAQAAGRKPQPQPALASAWEEVALTLEPEARKWLGFWSEEQRQQFFADLRADRLEPINQLLLQTRQPILSALHVELLAGANLEYQRPRKSVQMRLASRNGPDHDRFADAFRLLCSPRLKEQQTALRLFEQNMRENIKQEYEQGAREWVLYARARIQGGTRVAPDWERACKNDEASWEECWNLACYHRTTGDLSEAMRVLAPGLNELDAPVSHLRLAMLCALTLLLEPGQAEASALQNARDLLIYHLERWPHPLSCLAWLVLSYEVPGTLPPFAQSRRLSAFQELLECPVDWPEPRTDLTEQQLKALADGLMYKTHCEEAWFLWLNDYAARRPHNFPAWQCLAETSERMGRWARAELALQHIAGIYYDLDYIYAQEGEEEVQAAAALRQHVEKLFDFYRRHEMQRQAWDSFESCYATLKHLGFWDEQKAANRKLLTLVRPFLVEFQRREAQRQEAQRVADLQDAKSRSELRRSELSNNPTRPLEHFKSGRRVGIFVDYENIARFIPREEEMEHIGQMLVSYAAQFGEVVCRWASASPRNLSNLTAVRTGLEATQFKVRYPRRELQFSASQKDLADYALLECISTASLNDHLDVYLVVSGDRDYYERIYSLLESGGTVRILASASNLSASYRELELQRQRKHEAAEHEESDFFIDDLDEVLHSLLHVPR